jgi:hypothetical protein
MNRKLVGTDHAIDGNWDAGEVCQHVIETLPPSHGEQRF